MLHVFKGLSYEDKLAVIQRAALKKKESRTRYQARLARKMHSTLRLALSSHLMQSYLPLAGLMELRHFRA